MANLIVVCGPQAVGKMTVAESLRDKLRYNLMMNHDSIEVSDRIFGYATPAQKEFNAYFRQKTLSRPQGSSPHPHISSESQDILP